MVVSHERSRTHFLMNALAACYGYVSAPWVNLDLPTVNINYYYPPRVRDILLALAARPMANVVKSHHPADLFAAELPRLTERYDLAEGGRQGWKRPWRLRGSGMVTRTSLTASGLMTGLRDGEIARPTYPGPATLPIASGERP
jgi:hypothetical protein